MAKHFIPLFLALILALNLTACGGQQAAAPADAPAVSQPDAGAASSLEGISGSSEPMAGQEASSLPETNSSSGVLTEQKEGGAPLPAAGGTGPSDTGSSPASSGESSREQAAVGICELSITCDHLTSVDLVLEADVELYEGDSVWDVLYRAGVEHSVSVVKSGSGEGMYVKAIDGVWAKSHGDSSGWIYSVNGYYPENSCGGYYPKDGDSILWEYCAPDEKEDD